MQVLLDSVRRNARRALGLTVAASFIVALAGCTKVDPPAADAAYGTPIEINTPQGLRAKQTLDMLNSDWPIGPVGVRTLAVPEKVDDIAFRLDRIWWDRPFTVTDVEIGAGQARVGVLTSYGVAQELDALSQ